jgi:hypothetical protein
MENGGTDPAASRPDLATTTREEGSGADGGGSKASDDRCPRGWMQRGLEGGMGANSTPACAGTGGGNGSIRGGDAQKGEGRRGGQGLS